MSRFQNPGQTTPLSAVDPSVTNMIKAGQDTAARETALNNQAAAQRQQEQIARERMDLQEVLTGNALMQRTMAEKLRAEGFDKQRQMQFKIAEMQRESADAQRKGVADRHNAEMDMRKKVYDDQLALQAEKMRAEAELFQAESDDGNLRGRLDDLDAQIFDNVARTRQAEEELAGQRRGLGEIKADLLQGLSQHQSQNEGLINQGVANVSSLIADPGLPTGADDLEGDLQFLGLSEEGAASAANIIGAVGSAAIEAGTAGAFGGGNMRTERILSNLSTDPELAIANSTKYYKSLVKEAIEGAFPDSNSGQIALEFEKLMVDPNFSNEERATQLGQILQQNGADPMVVGEIFKRMGEGIKNQKVTLGNQFGISSRTLPGEVREDDNPGINRALIALKIYEPKRADFLGLVAAMPGYMNVDNLRAAVTEGSLPEVERAFLEFGGQTDFEGEDLIRALEEIEAGTRGISDLRVERGDLERSLDRAAVGGRVDTEERTRAARAESARRIAELLESRIDG